MLVQRRGNQATILKLAKALTYKNFDFCFAALATQQLSAATESLDLVGL